MIDLEILKKIFNLVDKEVEWGVIEEDIPEKEKVFKPGLLIKGSRLYVDLIARRFYTLMDITEVTRKIYPAEVIYQDFFMIFVAKEDSSKQVVKYRSLLDDIYYQSWYQDELEDEVLL